MTSPCSTFSRLEGYHYSELSADEASRVSSHVASCSSCHDELVELRRNDALLDGVRGDDLTDGVSDAQLGFMRTRIMATVRSQPAPSWTVRAAGFLAPLAGLAAAAAVLVLSMSGPANTDAPESAPTAVSSEVLEVADPQPIDMVTLASADGVRLNWGGTDKTYMVLKMRHPKDFAQAQVTVVCGHSWTDPDADEPGLVYYAVVPSPEPCA